MNYNIHGTHKSFIIWSFIFTGAGQSWKEHSSCLGLEKVYWLNASNQIYYDQLYYGVIYSAHIFNIIYNVICVITHKHEFTLSSS